MNHANENRTESRIEEIGAPTTRKVASVAHDAIDSAAATAEQAEQKVREGVHEAGEALEKSQARATEQIEDSIASIESFVRKRPVAAAGIAFAVGALATAVLRR